ncbi:cytochrome c [Vibrio sp. CAU 1672]|uniref:c-type cytochrome n=1 Tax=Vibrio sp. CAU 1672 TaxID=3032594 RepID=UPI0023DBCEEF|nr:cytochrome c [Vibrio sp. CAU 1672]MDF2153458.1 cytochrome c [Vibrio sp. CAU 1672]
MLRPSILLLALISGSSLAAAFGDAQQGKIKSPSCGFCHGTNGIASNSEYPNLAGQDPQYLFNAMKAYKNDQRTGPLAEMMKAQLSRLNDDDLRDVAAFYAEQAK